MSDRMRTGFFEARIGISAPLCFRVSVCEALIRPEKSFAHRDTETQRRRAMARRQGAS